MLLNHTSTLARPRVDQARLREGLIYVLLAMLVALVAVGGWLTYRFAMPWTLFEWTRIGSIEQYPPQDTPYMIQSEQTLFYLINDGDGLFAIYPETHFITRCHVLWDDFLGLFVDPCVGVGYSIYGDYLVSGPPPARGLDRFPVRVNKGSLIEVQLNNPQAGSTPELILQYCKFRPPSWSFTVSRFHAHSEWLRSQCDFRAFAHLMQPSH